VLQPLGHGMPYHLRAADQPAIRAAVVNRGRISAVSDGHSDARVAEVRGNVGVHDVDSTSQIVVDVVDVFDGEPRLNDLGQFRSDDVAHALLPLGSVVAGVPRGRSAASVVPVSHTQGHSRISSAERGRRTRRREAQSVGH